MAEDLAKQETISYHRLYRLWEENNWSATGIDLSVDADHWANRMEDNQREAALWNYALFLVGEEAVARTLTPVMDAAPTHEQSNFIATQIVDEARHHIFFDRFMREVAGRGTDIESTLAAMDPYLTWGFREVFAELDKVTDALHRKPKDLPLLAQTIALYHVVIEGVLAIPGQHFIQRYLEQFDLMPGFLTGITNVSRDESRHVAFGIKFLGDLFRMDPDCRAASIEMWDRVLQFTTGVFVPPDRDRSYAECFGFTVEEIFAFGMRSFETKLKRVGVDPSELQMLRTQDPEVSYEERARRAWVLIDDQVLGDNRLEPSPGRESLEILFEGMARTVDLEVLRTLGGPVEWNLTDAEAWHLVATNGHAEAKPGSAGDPALQLEASAADFARIAVGRADPRWALLKRRLKVHGSLAAKAKLPKLFT